MKYLLNVVFYIIDLQTPRSIEERGLMRVSACKAAG